jgi:hypothetical protein
MGCIKWLEIPCLECKVNCHFAGHPQFQAYVSGLPDTKAPTTWQECRETYVEAYNDIIGARYDDVWDLRTQQIRQTDWSGWKS